MNRECVKGNKGKLWSLSVALLLNLGILFVALVFSNMEFGTNDDRDISNLLANVTGSGYGHYITFVNVILAKALAYIYRWTNNWTNWYVVFSVIGSFVSLTAISYLLIERNKKRWRGLLCAGIITCALYESHYIIFQFTQNATLILMAGQLLLLDMFIFEWKQASLIQGIVGVVLFVLGSMIRFQSIYFVIPYLIMFVGYDLVFLKKPSRFSEWIKKRTKSLVCILIAIILVFTARGVHNAVYENNPVLKAFYQENLLRVELLDYGFPSYEENADKINALGLTEEDFILFQNQSFLDKNVFSYEVLEALVEMKAEKESSYSFLNLKGDKLLSVLSDMAKYVKDEIIIQVILAFAVIYFIGNSRRRWLVTLGSIVAPIAMLWYFYSVERIPYRIWYSIVAPAVIAMVYLYSIDSRPNKIDMATLKRKWSSKVASLLLVFSCALSLVNVAERAIEDDSVKITDTYEQVLNAAYHYTNTLVLLDRPTISPLTYNSTIDPMTCLKAESHKNICYQGGWICWTPDNLSVAYRWAEDSVYEAIGNGMEAILIDGRTPDLKLAFIRRHYNENVQMELVGAIGEIGIYRFFCPEV